MTDDLVAFLRARLDEIQRREEGRRSISGNLDFHWTQHGGDGEDYVLIGEEEVGVLMPAAEFYEQYGKPAADPKALADVDAKRRIVDLMERALQYAEGDTEVDHYGALSSAEGTLELLALPHADHPDYRDEWQPS